MHVGLAFGNIIFRSVVVANNSFENEHRKNHTIKSRTKPHLIFGRTGFFGNSRLTVIFLVIRLIEDILD